jgi:hypothetical protein
MTEVPLLWAIVKRLEAQLMPIEFTSDSRGAVYNMADRVFIGSAKVSNLESVPSIYISEAPEQDSAVAAGGGNLATFDKMYYIQGFAPRDAQNGDTKEAYALQALVLARIGRLVQLNQNGAEEYPEEYLLGLREVSGIETTLPLVIMPENPRVDAAVFYLPVLVKVTINPFKPYTNV